MNNNNQKFTDDVYDDHTVTTVDITSNPSSFSSIESMEDLCKLSDESFDASKFELHSILGTGSFGTAFLAEYDHTYVSTREGSVTKSVHQKYAVKSVPKDKMQDSELADLMNEKQILSSMVNPFLLRFYGSCQTNDELYFVTETVECGELFHAIYDGDKGLSHADRVFYSACILLGIDYIHSKKVVFRDLKPENIMIGKNGYPKIIDFGLAKQLPYTKLSEDNIIRKYTKCYTMCGTPEYISPEMLVKKEYDYAVDLWAFGVLIYEMVFMITPFVNNADSSDFTTMFSNILQSAKQGILISKKMDKKTDGTPNSRNFITQLLSGNEKVRLGDAASPCGLLQRPYFSSVSARESELYAQTYTPPSFRDVFIGRDIETRKQVKRYSGDQTRFRDFDMFLVPKDKII
jgi:serine/threonine protein kinase